MKVPCPNCGEIITVSGLGRKPLNIPLIIVCDTLQAHRSVLAAATELECSQGYIFKVLKENGVKLSDVINDRVRTPAKKTRRKTKTLAALV